MQKLSQWAIAVTGIAAIWFTIPLALTTYINKKYAPEIKVSHVSIVGLDCVKLTNIHINKPTISGNIDFATVCYHNKTIDINGGKLNIKIGNTSGKNDSHGFSINANELEIHLTKGNVSADLYKATIKQSLICAEKTLLFHPKADAMVFNLCIDRKNNSVMASNGSITPKFELEGYKFGNVSFVSLFKATKNEISLGEIKYEDTSASNILAFRKNGLISISIGSVVASHKKLFAKPLSIINIKVNDILESNPLKSKVVINIDNTVSVLADIENKRLSGKDSCNNWFKVVPIELKNDQISQMKLKGSFGFDVQLNPVSLKINNTCKIDGDTPQFITDLSKPFKYTAYHPDGIPFERTSGPGTSDWIPLDFVDNMATALTITEDPGFWNHRGIIPKAIENSLKDDIRLGRFFRGGSTITMQLAKNLWLNRNKSIGRKLQEGILTIALESGLSKEKILELYLNVVEFGPNTYGIGPGCAKFLKKYPGEISISEALYMATRLPSPNKAHSYDANKGFVKKLIAIGVASGKILEAELAEELQAEQIKEEQEQEEVEDDN
jgi:hypothetical protein